jgi:uncharacterized protein (DUF2345 family)
MTFDGTTDHGGVVIGGSGSVIIGNTHTPAPFIPPLPIVGLPLVDFTVISAVDGEPIVQQTYELETAEGRIVKGQTNAQGLTQSLTTRQPDLVMVRWAV